LGTGLKEECTSVSSRSSTNVFFLKSRASLGGHDALPTYGGGVILRNPRDDTVDGEHGSKLPTSPKRESDA
jgi:hypothetical protein